MKKLWMFALTGFVLMTFANCGKKNSDAPTGNKSMSATCYVNQMMGVGSSTTSTACHYDYSTVQGFSASGNGSGWNYTAGYGYGSGFCQGSTTMAYSPSKGMGCVDTTNISIGGNVAVYDLNATSGAFTLISTAATSQLIYSQYGTYGFQQAYSALYPTETTGGSGVYTLRVCDANELCAESQTCRSPLGDTSTTIGICYHN